MTIRPAEPEDAQAIAEAVRASYGHVPAAHVPYDMPLYHGEHHRSGMADPDLRWAVLCVENQCAGVAVWRMLPGLAHLHQLFVAAEHQGKGHGVRLLRHHQEEARREQPEVRVYTLHCHRDAYWAMRFYKHQGYTLYEPGAEGRVPDLHVWIDACRRHDGGWPLKADKALHYKLASGGHH